MHHLIDILDLSTSEIEELISVASDIIEHPENYREKCKYQKLATLFFEPSSYFAKIDLIRTIVYKIYGPVFPSKEMKRSTSNT